MALETGLPFSSVALRTLFFSDFTRAFSASGSSSCGSPSAMASTLPLEYMTVSMKSIPTRGLDSSSLVAMAMILVRRSSNVAWMSSTSPWLSTLFSTRYAA